MNDDMKIDNGYHVPEVQRGTKKIKYPFKQMAVGQSLFFADEPEGRRALAAAHAFAKRRYSQRWRTDAGELINVDAMDVRELCALPEGRYVVIGRWAFTGRQIDGGWRIWRVADVPIDKSEVIDLQGQKWIDSEST